jgi:hypothetical protein
MEGAYKGCKAARERSKLASAASGDSDEVLELVCTRQPDGQAQNAAARFEILEKFLFRTF